LTLTDVLDVATVELHYAMRQGQALIDPDHIQTYFASFGNAKIAMEMIPIEIFKFCRLPSVALDVPIDKCMRYDALRRINSDERAQ